MYAAFLYMYMKEFLVHKDMSNEREVSHLYKTTDIK